MNPLLRQLEELHTKATPEPWTRQTIVLPDGIGGYMQFPSFGVPYEGGETAPTNIQPELDSDVICRLRNSLPQIIAALKAGDRLSAAAYTVSQQHQAGYTEPSDEYSARVELDEAFVAYEKAKKGGALIADGRVFMVNESTPAPETMQFGSSEYTPKS